MSCEEERRETEESREATEEGKEATEEDLRIFQTLCISSPRKVFFVRVTSNLSQSLDAPVYLHISVLDTYIRGMTVHISKFFSSNALSFPTA